MSISGILSGFRQNQVSGASTYQWELQQLGKNLQSGKLAAAQPDFAALQKAVSQTSASNAGSSSSVPATQAFNQLASDLQSGNLPAAQKDISIVQQVLQSLNGSPAANPFRPHHHLGGGSGDSTKQTTLLQDASQIGQSLASGNLSSAQQAYTTLQQQLQQFALGAGAISPRVPVSLEA